MCFFINLIHITMAVEKADISSELAHITAQRGHVRTNLAKLYNSKDTFLSLPKIEKLTKRNKIQKLNEQLLELNSQIQIIVFGTDQKKYEKDLLDCDKYSDMVIESLTLLSDEAAEGAVTGAGGGRGTSADDPHSCARTLLRNPVAPLPTYSGSEDEDLTRFLTQFQETQI